jgi:acyl CoA:acetate/3-ketoacid CoA transferase beta subunit
MSSAVRLLDNQGFVVPPGVIGYTPIHGTGGVATDAATGGDETLTVTAGATYLIQATATGVCIFGLATILTAANVAWMVPAGQQITITIPIGYTTLHWESLTSGGGFYYTQLSM